MSFAPLCPLVMVFALLTTIVARHSHHFTETPEASVREILRAGTDVDCGHFVLENIQSAIDKGVVTVEDVDLAISRQFRLRMRLSHFDPEGPLQKIPMSDVCSDFSIDLSHDGLVQSATLLKNDGDTLPLSAKEAGSIVVIGPNSELGQATASYYGPERHCLGNFTLVDAIKDYVEDTTTVAGVDEVLSEDISGIPDAVKAAEQADQVILAVGTDLTWAREAHDAESIAFTDAQAQLIEQVSAAAKKPVVLVMFTATPLDISDVLENKNIGAVLHVGQPSVTIKGAGDLLFGKVSPAGRMVQTVYKKEYMDMISIFDFNMRPGPSTFPRPDCTLIDDVDSCQRGTNPGRTYRFYTGEPVVEFGFGLSYTTFDYSVVDAKQTMDLKEVEKMLREAEEIGKIGTLKKNVKDESGFIIEVTNTGDMDADEVVLGFVTPPGAGTDGVPLKSLFAFERIHVKAGETETVTLVPGLTDYTIVQQDGVRVAREGKYTFEFGVKSGGAFTKLQQYAAV